MSQCIFCKIVKNEIPAKKVWEDDDIVAFEDINPQAPKHVLIVPKRHIESVGRVSDEDRGIMGKLLLAGRDVAKKLGIIDAFQLKIYSGEDAGQTVFHLHVHLLGGWRNKQNH